MSIQRSPPHKYSGSQPDLSKLREEALLNVSDRKRKMPECSCDFEDKFSQLQQNLIASINVTLEKQNKNIQSALDLLRDDLKGFRQEMRDIKDKIQNLTIEHTKINNEIRDLKSSNTINNNKIDSVTKSASEMQSTIKDLSEQLQVKEQQGRLNNLEIAGVPIRKGENLINIVHNIATKIGFPLTSSDIDYVHRVRRFTSNKSNSDGQASGESSQDSSTIPNIIIRFTQRKRKSEMLAAVRARRELTSADAGLDGASKPIFINDHLTPQNKLLFRQARLLGKEKDYKFIWLSDCKILMRKSDDSKVIHISNIQDLAKIK
ncbi:hypothetical protein ABMA27_008772 [Loxostege sticticalis]|uniref:FP protein C-terminal domain-containing protein n=1 Tax=Loxostege sticticalis TaxID=481309 RepID=A0ABR3H8U3_LOXSC